GNTASDTVFVFAADATSPIISVSHSPEFPYDTDAVTINAIVTDASSLSSVILSYSVNYNSTWSNVSMTISGEYWTAEIPVQSAGSNIQYMVYAMDDAGNLGLSDSESYSVNQSSTTTTTAITTTTTSSTYTSTNSMTTTPTSSITSMTSVSTSETQTTTSTSTTPAVTSTTTPSLSVADSTMMLVLTVGVIGGAIVVIAVFVVMKKQSV
ncbi:MAG: hypothetical protein RTU92_12805, partial [Candidatus Thorarchaeota archaeon]